MSVAVIARLDGVTALHVDTLLKALPDRHVRRCPAHIRLTTSDDEVDVGGLNEAMAGATRTWTKLSIALVGVGVFPSEPAALWLSERVTDPRR